MSREEFKIFFDDYFDQVRNYIYYRSGNEELATDVAQEAFIKIWEKHPNPLHNNLKALVYKIAHDVFISSYRRSELHLKYQKEIKFQYEEAGESIDIEYRELRKKYESTLAKMPDKQREVFLMNRAEEFKYTEIAERLGISLKAVEKRMKKALEILRKELKDNTSLNYEL